MYQNAAFSESGLTACVTGRGAGLDNVREQKKLEARNLPDKPHSPDVHCALLAQNFFVDPVHPTSPSVPDLDP